jgi:hypothetical protein
MFRTTEPETDTFISELAHFHFRWSRQSEMFSNKLMTENGKYLISG